MAQIDNSDRIVRELADIKRLLILQLITSGVEAQYVAKALRISKSTLSGIVSARSIKKTKG